MVQLVVTDISVSLKPEIKIILFYRRHSYGEICFKVNDNFMKLAPRVTPDRATGPKPPRAAIVSKTLVFARSVNKVNKIFRLSMG